MSKKPAEVKKRRRLGRGLSSLMAHPIQVAPSTQTPEIESDEPSNPETGTIKPTADRQTAESQRGVAPSYDDGEGSPAASDVVFNIPLDQIQPNAHQPRQDINESNLTELVASIRESGIMQPILVRPNESAADTNQPYELVAGERRWRAAKLAGLDAVPALLRTIDDQESAQWAIVENLQREDLNPIEKAEAFRHLMDEFQLTQAQVAERVGIDRSSVANLLRLNQLDSMTRDDVRAGRLSLGHAKVLLTLPDTETQRKIAEACLFGFWSVRELEKRVKDLLSAASTSGLANTEPGGGSGGATAKPEHIQTLERELAELMNTKTEIKLSKSRKAGKIVISFKTVDQFEILVDQLRAMGEVASGS